MDAASSIHSPKLRLLQRSPPEVTQRGALLSGPARPEPAHSEAVPGRTRARAPRLPSTRQSPHTESRPIAEFRAHALCKYLNSSDKGHNGGSLVWLHKAAPNGANRFWQLTNSPLAWGRALPAGDG